MRCNDVVIDELHATNESIATAQKQLSISWRRHRGFAGIVAAPADDRSVR